MEKFISDTAVDINVLISKIRQQKKTTTVEKSGEIHAHRLPQ